MVSHHVRVKKASWSVCVWRISYCGIFCNSQERGAGKGKISRHLSSPGRVSGLPHVRILWSLPKRLLQLSKATGAAGVRRRVGHADSRVPSALQATYGYRRIWRWLKSTKDIHHNPKTILRVMKKYGLLSEIRRSRKWVRMGQQVHKYENLFNRQFRADRPNQKWVTDISYIHTKQGVLYLSMIRDLYDNSIVAYKTATQQTVNLVLDTIRLFWRLA